MSRLLALLASKRALEEARERAQKQRDSAYALCESLRQDHAETQRELASCRADFATLNAACKELLKLAEQMQRERDAARRVMRDALNVAGFGSTFDDIRKLPEWGEMQ